LLIEEQLTEQLIGAFIEVHSQPGAGLLESAYQECLCHELTLRNIGFQREVPLPVIYKGIKLDCGYRLDIVAEEKVVIEIKTVEKLLPVHEAQLLTYLKLSGYKVGLLVNFNCEVIRNGLKRMVL
jgi:GxxExxY protein